MVVMGLSLTGWLAKRVLKSAEPPEPRGHEGFGERRYGALAYMRRSRDRDRRFTVLEANADVAIVNRRDDRAAPSPFRVRRRVHR
jgi:hypothetical protein